MITESRLGPGLLTLDKSGTPLELASQVTNVVLSPNIDRGDPRPVLSGEQLPGKRTEKWTLKGKLIPDFGQVESIQEWLFTNRGREFDCEFVPDRELSKKLTCKVTVEATDIGGDVASSDEIEFEWQLLGKPSLAEYTPDPTP